MLTGACGGKAVPANRLGDWGYGAVFLDDCFSEDAPRPSNKTFAGCKTDKGIKKIYIYLKGVEKEIKMTSFLKKISKKREVRAKV